ncbi:MAG: hypothetical protein RL768_2892 [Nitrospirota bacterium]
MNRSRQSLAEPIITIRRGLAIYKIHASPYWFCRMRIPSKRGYVVRSTKESRRLDARKVAEELYIKESQFAYLPAPPPKDTLFDTYAEKLVEHQFQLAKEGHCSLSLAKSDKNLVYTPKSGLLAYFGGKAITEIRTKDVKAYLQWMKQLRTEPYAFNTYSTRIACLRKILKLAVDDEVIEAVPATPRPERKDSPRGFFRFSPLVSKEHDEYERVLKTAKDMAEQGVKVRWVPVTDELYDLILFLSHTFLRPTYSEVYALKHRDVAIAEDPKRLVLRIVRGKTGFRQVNTLEAAVSVYLRSRKRSPNWTPDDYVFLPHYANRHTAQNRISLQFRELLKRAGLTHGEDGIVRTLYSIRHTALCMRLVKSQGKV